MNILSLFGPIRQFIFDIDGVLTDGTVLVLENGLQARRMSIRDGYALQLAVKLGYRITIVSGGNSPQVADRLVLLGVTDVHMKVLDKKAFLSDLIRANKLEKQQVLFMGDDIPDLPAIDVAGLSSCPSDAASEIREAVQYISPFAGGAGCVRDVIEKVLKLNNHWNYHPEVPSR